VSSSNTPFAGLETAQRTRNSSDSQFSKMT
jgi:hypothetical protein